MTQELGRREPTDWKHVEKYPLSALPEKLIKPTPVQLGINWYTNFDNPVPDGKGHYYIGRGNLGTIRGGHSVCVQPHALSDLYSWYVYYNQMTEGKCVGEAGCRMMSLLNRMQYDPTWLWNQAKIVDEWPETNPGDNNGTSVRAACSVLKNKGPLRTGALNPLQSDGISVYRWATTAQEVLDTVGTPTWSYVVIINSWGKSYPRYVRMPVTTLQRLLNENGEAAIVTDR